MPDAALPAIGLEAINRDARRQTGVAFAAVRPVDEVSAAPETKLHEFGVLLAVKRLTRIEKERHRRAPRQVAAGMRHGEKYFRWFLAARHVVVV